MPAPRLSPNLTFLMLVGIVFIGYMPVALPLAAIPIYVRNQLMYSDLLVGLVVGCQFVVTVLARNHIGRFVDYVGGKKGSISGLIICALAGACFLPIDLFSLPGWFNYALLLLGRGLMGIGQGVLLTGIMLWGLGYLGNQHSGRIMALNGMAIYLSMAAATPLGLIIADNYGMLGLGWASIALPLVGLGLTLCFKSTPVANQDKRLPFTRVIAIIWRHGLCLGLHAVGFAVTTAFSALYFANNNWGNAGLGLTCFGLGYALVRVFLSNAPDRWGGIKVSKYSFALECLGLALIWLASNGAWAMAGFFITGVGCSLIFPGLGAEVVKIAPANMQGTAISVYTAFQDITFGLAAPLLGLMIPFYGYASAFLAAAGCALLGLALLMFFFSKGARGCGQ